MHRDRQARLDTFFLLNNNDITRVEFTQSARKHKIGRARVLEVLANPVVALPGDPVPGLPPRLLILGEDQSGRALDVVIVVETDRLVVVHAMDLRAKFRPAFQRGQQS